MSLLSMLEERKTRLSPTRRELLDGLLGEDALSDAALGRWASAVNIDDLDAASYRLIPALYARCGSKPMLSALHGRMKGIYRYYFYRNNRFLTFVETVLKAFAAAKIEFIVFKGTSILLQYHSGAALRSFGDCDILVHRRDKMRSEAVLRACGLQYRYYALRKFMDRHSHDFVDKLDNGIDLHWYALLENCREGADEGLWSRSRLIQWRGLNLRVLSPEDEVLVAGMNGIREKKNVRADWLFDVWIILKKWPDLDWRLIHQELKERRLNRRFVDALVTLNRFVPHFPGILIEKEFGPELETAAKWPRRLGLWNLLSRSQATN